jgi:hypothetical protein
MIDVKPTFYTQREIESKGYRVENNVIESIGVEVIGHFGNCACLTMKCKSVWPVSGYNNTANLGCLIHELVELLELTEEDGVMLDRIKDVPVRLVFGAGGSDKCIGFGHFMDDKFVLTNEFVTVGLKTF